MKILFIVNCGRRNKAPETELLQQFEALFRERGVDYRLAPCFTAEESQKAVQDIHDQGFDTLWIGGGDGSINQILNATFGSGMTYGIVPMGTVNALARSLNIPSDDPMEAARYLLEAKPTPIDVIRVNEFYFMCYASVGYHAALMHGISPRTKKRFGKLAFWTSGARAALQMGSLPQFTIEYDPVEASGGLPVNTQTTCLRRSGHSLILSNICNFAGFGIVQDQACNSRYLEMHLFEKRGRLPMMRWFAAMRLSDRMQAAHTNGKDIGVTQDKIASCTLTSPAPLALQIDGEPVTPANPCELRFEVIPAGVQILLK